MCFLHWRLIELVIVTTLVMNSLRIKGINIDEAFSVLVKIMKKVKFGVGLIDMELN